MAEVKTPDEQNSYVFREGNGTLATPSSEFTPLPDTVADPETPAVIE